MTSQIRSKWQGVRCVAAVIVTTVVLLGLPTPHAAGQQPGGQAADSAAVAQTLERFVRAFNDLEWESFREHFADDVSVFFPLRSSRMRADGRAEVERVFGELFRSARSSGSRPPYLNIRPRDVRIQMLGATAVAVFHLGSDDEPSVGRRTLVLRRAVAALGGSFTCIPPHSTAGSRSRRAADPERSGRRRRRRITTSTCRAPNCFRLWRRRCA